MAFNGSMHKIWHFYVEFCDAGPFGYPVRVAEQLFIDIEMTRLQRRNGFPN